VREALGQPPGGQLTQTLHQAVRAALSLTPRASSGPLLEAAYELVAACYGVVACYEQSLLVAARSV